MAQMIRMNTRIAVRPLGRWKERVVNIQKYIRNFKWGCLNSVAAQEKDEAIKGTDMVRVECCNKLPYVGDTSEVVKAQTR